MVLLIIYSFTNINFFSHEKTLFLLRDVMDVYDYKEIIISKKRLKSFEAHFVLRNY